MTPLQTLLNDEQKAFEKDFPYCDSDFCYCWKKETQDKQKAFLALHDQKIITAVIGMCEKGYAIGWEQKCKGCGHHDSMWKTLVTSPQWLAWEEEQRGARQNYDVDECRELGVMSAGHFQAFMKFITHQKD